jgi:hypothetical protein
LEAFDLVPAWLGIKESAQYLGTGSAPENDALVAIDLLDEPEEQGDLGRGIVATAAHDDRRERVGLVERRVEDVVPAQPLVDQRGIRTPLTG